MNHKEFSSDTHTATVLCSGAVENSSSLSFLDDYVKKKIELTLDFEGVSYINSCGFGALVEGHLLFENKGLKLYFKNIDPTIRKTISYLGAEELLNILA